MSDKLTAILAELRRRFEALYGERSDIDVLVVLKDPVCAGEEIDRTIDFVADLSFQHNEVISCAFIGEKRFKHRHGPLLRNVRREGIRI